MTEAQARLKYGSENVGDYETRFTNLAYALMPTNPKPVTCYKLVVNRADEERLLGVHLVGLGSDEILQGFAVAISMGARKADLDRTIAIHPTAGEELVTMK